MKKIAMVYYSMTGNVQWVADALALAGADLVPLKPQKSYPDKGFKKFLWGGKSAIMGETPPLEPYQVNWDAYDLIILGTPVWASNIAPPLRTFITDNLSFLRSKSLAAVLCFSGGGADKALAKVDKQFGLQFVRTLVLVDPKDKPEQNKQQALEAFCAAIAED